jgi:hypothetical protein
LVFKVETKGRNQCTGMNINDLRYQLPFKVSSVKMSNRIAGLSTKDIQNFDSADVTILG